MANRPDAPPKKVDDRPAPKTFGSVEKTIPGSGFAAFEAAYNRFIEPPNTNAANPSDRSAIGNISRRQSDFKTLLYLAQRDEVLARWLLCIIADEAPHYCHEFSPYFIPIAAEAAATPLPVTQLSGARRTTWLDPEGPLDHAKLVRNGDVAMETLFLDALKVLEKENFGVRLIELLVIRKADGTPDKGEDLRTQRLLLSALLSSDLEVDADAVTDFLKENVKTTGASFSRLALIPKAIDNPKSVAESLLSVLVAQLDDNQDMGSDIGDAVFAALNTVKGVKSDQPPVCDESCKCKPIPPRYDFLCELANLPVKKPTQANKCKELLRSAHRNACVDAIAYFIALAIAGKQPDEWVTWTRPDLCPKPAKEPSPGPLEPFRVQLRLVIREELIPKLLADSKLPPDERYFRLVFLNKVWQVLYSKPSDYLDLGVTTKLVAVLNDAEFYKKKPASRIVSAQLLGHLGANFDDGTVCDTLRGLLFSSTPEEQAEILQALALLTGAKEWP